MIGPPPPNSNPQLAGAGEPLKRSAWRLKHFGEPAGFALLCALLFFAGALAAAQAEAVSDNDVIRVAERMYCPVCENIPLDDCETIACMEWKAEIRAQLAAGRSDQAVIDSFVARFGDNVVGVPQDPVLRALTVIMPLLATALAIGAAAFTFKRFGAEQKLSAAPRAQAEGSGAYSTVDGKMTDAAYRQRLEDDVRGRR